VQVKRSGRSHNRYSYVYNSPLSATDPSGYFLKWIERKVRKEYKRSAIFRAIVGIAAAYFAGQFMKGYLGGLGDSFFTVGYTEAGAGYSTFVQTGLSTPGKVLVGATGGFAGGLASSGGDLKAAFQGALSGGISAGITGYYGRTYPFERVIADGLAGGLFEKLRGGEFSDGFKTNFITSGLMYLNLQMRQEMIQNSLASNDPNVRRMNDGTGLSAGLNGDEFKLGGGRWNSFLPGEVTQCSLLGCQQSGPGKIFGISYSKGGFADLLVESFAGPHDYANSPWFYKTDGTIHEMSKIRAAVLDMLTNYTTSLVFAAPFAAGAIAQHTNLTAYWSAAKQPQKFAPQDKGR
jgi:filamentous hemagglutinin